LHDAARDGNAGQAVQLVEHGADVTQPDDTGEPPLLIAALAGHADAVAVLLDHGAPLESRNRHGLTALHAAAYGGNLAIVELLVARGAAVNDTQNFYHMTPLHAAAEEGRSEIVAFLLAHGAVVEAKERNGYTPLSQAGWRGYWDTASLLMKAGAKCQAADIVGDRLYQECMKHM
jgi:ankyrin repeat protein